MFQIHNDQVLPNVAFFSCEVQHCSQSVGDAEDVRVRVGLANWEINYRDDIFSGPDLSDLTYESDQAIATWAVGDLGM